MKFIFNFRFSSKKSQSQHHSFYNTVLLQKPHSFYKSQIIQHCKNIYTPATQPKVLLTFHVFWQTFSLKVSVKKFALRLFQTPKNSILEALERHLLYLFRSIFNKILQLLITFMFICLCFQFNHIETSQMICIATHLVAF